MPGHPGLHVRDLHKRWPTRPAPVLRGASLTLMPGEVVLVDGANGAGKTTLLRVLAGLIDADAGTVRLYGTDPTADRRGYQRRVGYVPAGGQALYARLTAYQHLRLWARLAFMEPGTVRPRITAVVERFDLEPLLRQRMDRLSQGQRQRVRLALAFLPTPDLLILDEPDTSLDAAGRVRLRAAVNDALEQGAAALWAAPEAPADALGTTMALFDGQLRPR